MTGIIRSSNTYSDNQLSFEIDIYLDYDNEYPVKDGQRVSSTLIVEGNEFICGIRYTENAGPWMSPDLKDVHGKKVRLSEVLLKNGFSKNEEVKLEYDRVSNVIKIVKLL